MKNKSLLHMVSLITMLIIITSLQQALALPKGQGVQNFTPGQSTDDFLFAKGEFFHAIFDTGDLSVKAGTWLTIGFGVSGIYSADYDINQAIIENVQFVDDSDWTILFDGVDISYQVSHADFAKDSFVFYFDDEFGNPMVQVITRYAFYIVPQHIGCYDYYGGVSFGGDIIFERSNTICWLSANKM